MLTSTVLAPGIFIRQHLTKISSGFTLQNVPSKSITRHYSKQNTGGKVEYMQPPIMSGFFNSATFVGDCTRLARVVRNTKPSFGNTYSVKPVFTLRGSRQLFSWQNSKQNTGNNAMKNAIKPATSAPAPMAKGLTNPAHTNQKSPFSIENNALLDIIRRAKAKHQREERGAAYNELLQDFHRLILPVFVAETGSVTQASNMLGLHRQTMSKYIDLAGIELVATSAGGVK